MTTRIELRNRNTFIHDLPRKLAKTLDKATSYYVEGFFFAPSFKARRWDGKEHLLKKRADGSYRLPSGLARRVQRHFEDAGHEYTVDDERTLGKRVVESKWQGFTLRPYQKFAVEAFVAGDGPGILKMAIRSGKTVVAGAVIHELGVETLIVVPSTLLLHQTAGALESCLGVEVGRLGDGKRTEGAHVNVATVQTLVKMKEKGDPLYQRLAADVDLLIIDEAHHAKADTWRTITLDIDSYWVLGLTATPPLLETKKGATKGGIWLTAIAGDIVFETNIKDLIEGGYLVKPLIELHKIHSPDLEGVPWSDGLRRSGILLNQYRNNIVVSRAIEEAGDGKRVLIVCTRTEQVSALSKMFWENQMTVPTVTGKMKTSDRHSVIDAFVNKRAPIVISTVMGEGIDIPAVEVMINAAGGKSHIGTIQRMRNLTKSEGKDSALVIDFLDYQNGYFAEHSQERMKTYREQGAFDFKVVG